MIFEYLHPVLTQIEQVFLPQIRVVIPLAILFSVLTVFTSEVSSPGKVWWKNPGPRLSNAR